MLFAELRGDRSGSAATELTDERGFDSLGLSGPASVSGNPELPALGGGLRRFAFVLVGCRNESARLTISARTLDAELVGPDDDPGPCAASTSYLAVFDVPAGDVPAGALVG